MVRWRGRTMARFLLVFLAPSALSQDRAVFTAEADLQSIAVEVTDRQGRDIRGLTLADFTLLEDGRPQKIAFFGAEEQPISLAVLIDSSASMRLGHKLDGVRQALPPLLRGNLPGDEIYFAQFTDHVFPVQPLTGEERTRPPIRQVDSRAGTAFYDALATALCRLRGARNLRQAVVAITDGTDQHSRLTLDQLIQTAQASRPQIFTIGFFDDREADIFRNSGKVVTLVNSHEIDNPLKVFERIAKETGAEAFFPASQRDLERALTRILGILRGQYTLAYHTERPNAFRHIQVKVNRPGVIVLARRGVGSEGGDGGTPRFSITNCEVSASKHPYPWEPHVRKTPDGLTVYSEDFSNSRSGWPQRTGFRYVGSAYEISIPPPPTIPSPGRRGGSVDAQAPGLGTRDPGEIAAYGPLFTDFRASVKIESHDGDGGLIFRLNERGYYRLLLQKGNRHGAKGFEETISYKLEKKFWDTDSDEAMIPWTVFRTGLSDTIAKPGPQSPWVTAGVKCAGNRITVQIDGIEAISLTDDSFADGEVGMGFWGRGRALFRDLQVEELK
jgi:Ca-activated chloride channel family protein